MRLPRVTVPGAFHHVISRFVDRDWLFRDDTERERYLHYFGRAVEGTDWVAVAYALMSSHIHHGLIAGQMPIELLLKRVHAPFARWMNKRYGRLGPIFADRAATWVMRPEHVAATIAYIHDNPVRAGVVSQAVDSHWTSHRAYAGVEPVPRWLSVDAGRALAGVDPLRCEGTGGEHAGPDARAELGRIQRAAHRRGAIELGTPTAQPTVVPLVARPFARVRPAAQDVVSAVARLLRIPSSQFASRSQQAICVRARTAAAHVGQQLGITGSDIASALGITRQAVSRLARQPPDELTNAIVRVVCEQLTDVPPSPAKGAQRHGLRLRRS